MICKVCTKEFQPKNNKSNKLSLPNHCSVVCAKLSQRVAMLRADANAIMREEVKASSYFIKNYKL